MCRDVMLPVMVRSCEVSVNVVRLHLARSCDLATQIWLIEFIGASLSEPHTDRYLMVLPYTMNYGIFRYVRMSNR